MSTTVEYTSQELIAAILRTKSGRELRKEVRHLVETEQIRLRGLGIDNVFDYYEHVEMPAQGVGGYTSALTALGIDDDKIADLRKRLQNLAQKTGVDSSQIDTENVSQRIARGVKNVFLKLYAFDVLTNKELPTYEEENRGICESIGFGNWLERVRNQVEELVGFAKSTKRATMKLALSAADIERARSTAVAYLNRKLGISETK